jgi:hypothetical protein
MLIERTQPKRQKFCWKHMRYFPEGEECPVCWRVKEIKRQREIKN